MNRIKLLGVIPVVMCAMGLMATSAFALPDVSITLCTGSCVYPLHTNYESATVKTKLENVNGGVLTGEGLHLLVLLGQLSNEGTFRAIFLKVTKGTEKCFNQGVEANGEVLTEGPVALVYTSLAGSTQGLQLGALFSPKELTGATEISCPTNANKTKVKGSMLGTENNAEGAGNTTQLTSGRGRLSGSLGKAAFRAYYNASGVGQLAQLLSNVDGAGFKESNQVVEGEPLLEALEGKMFVVSGR